ncbi:MAG: hypothetical protein V8R30_02025 [Clostridia bacterium]
MNNVENEEDFNNDLRDIIKAQNGNEDIMEQLIEKNKGLFGALFVDLKIEVWKQTIYIKLEYLVL